MRHIILLYTMVSLVMITGADLYAQDQENVELITLLMDRWDCANDIALFDGYAYIPTGGCVRIMNVT
ncbi:hypothetical protein ACFLQJ_00795, partial [Calditrichota bacterium]